MTDLDAARTVASPLGEMPDIAEGSTLDLILQAAGHMFSAKGFHGTSTREIAQAVGIRQPSLFHHFASKTAIAQHLLEYDRSRSPFLLGRTELPDEGPAVRLYHSLRREIIVELTSRYELRGLYLTDVLEEDCFLFWKTQYDLALERSRALIQEGIDSGDFIGHAPNIVVQLFDAMLNWIVRLRKNQPSDLDPDAIAALLLRAILAKPDDIAAIRLAADRAHQAL